jgi:mono/diheme cytochrome c family protein
MLKPFLLLSAVVLFVIAPAPTPTLAAGGPPQDNSPIKTTAAAREKARKLYGVDCSMCHGDNGDGKTDMAKDMTLTLANWTDPKSLATVPDKQLFDTIRKGKGDKMPPEDASRAKDEEVWALIAYIRGFSKGQPSAPAPAPADAAPATPAPAPADATPAPAPADAAPTAPAAPAPANPGR